MKGSTLGPMVCRLQHEQARSHSARLWKGFPWRERLPAAQQLSWAILPFQVTKSEAGQRKVMARGTYEHLLSLTRWGSRADADTYMEGTMQGWKMDNRLVEGSLMEKTKMSFCSLKTKAKGLMQRQDTYFPVLVKEERATIALSAYTFSGTAECLGWCLRPAGKERMQQKD